MENVVELRPRENLVHKQTAEVMHFLSSQNTNILQKNRFGVRLPNQNLREIIRGINPAVEKKDIPNIFAKVQEVMESSKNANIELENILDSNEEAELEKLITSGAGFASQVELAAKTIGSYAESMTLNFCEFYGLEKNQILFSYFFYCGLVSGGINAGMIYDEDFNMDEIQNYIVGSRHHLKSVAEQLFNEIKTSDKTWKLALLQMTFKHHKYIKQLPDFAKFAHKLQILNSTFYNDVLANAQPKENDKEKMLNAMLQFVGINPALAPAFLERTNDRYIGVINYKSRSSVHRAFLLDLKTGEVETSPCSHSAKSASFIDEAYADKFSDRDGYNNIGFFDPGKITFIPAKFAEAFGVVNTTLSSAIYVDEKIINKLNKSLVFINA